MHLRLFQYSAALLAVLVLMTGCNVPARSADTKAVTATSAVTAPTPSATQPLPTATITLAEGWELYETPEEGFAIALPPTWSDVDLDAETVESALETLREQNPDIANLLSDQTDDLIASGVKFWAFDTEVNFEECECTLLNIITTPMPKGAHARMIAASAVGQIRKQYESMLVTAISRDQLDTAAGKAETLTYDLSIVKPNGKTVLQHTAQYVLVENGKAYILTFATTGEAEKNLEIFEEIATTFQIIK